MNQPTKYQLTRAKRNAASGNNCYYIIRYVLTGQDRNITSGNG